MPISTHEAVEAHKALISADEALRFEPLQGSFRRSPSRRHRDGDQESPVVPSSRRRLCCKGRWRRAVALLSRDSRNSLWAILRSTMGRSARYLAFCDQFGHGVTVGGVGRRGHDLVYEL